MMDYSLIGVTSRKLMGWYMYLNIHFPVSFNYMKVLCNMYINYGMFPLLNTIEYILVNFDMFLQIIASDFVNVM